MVFVHKSLFGGGVAGAYALPKEVNKCRLRQGKCKRQKWGRTACGKESTSDVVFLPLCFPGMEFQLRLARDGIPGYVCRDRIPANKNGRRMWRFAGRLSVPGASSQLWNPQTKYPDKPWLSWSAGTCLPGYVESLYDKRTSKKHRTRQQENQILE